MRFGNFEGSAYKPIGSGRDKRVFINPEDPQSVIAEIRNNKRETVRQLKGRYYLTKILHILLPENIPDIYQVRETETNQTIDSEYIPHTRSYRRLHKEVIKNPYSTRAQEMARSHERALNGGEVDLKFELAKLLGPQTVIDDNHLNYMDTKRNLLEFLRGKKSAAIFLETLKPWVIDSYYKSIVPLYDEEMIRRRIEKLEDPHQKETATKYLLRLLTLFKEEEIEIRS